ncbi:MAG: phospholipid carrier-dependent glycosyltransferase, partial [Candidatus Dormibacteraeota bacterium]|nr:phospholipid carrier-dependent glycosyltransferase [Candidatus Dormibacteraeota bacterium]
MSEGPADAVVRRYFDRWDLVALLALTAVAFVLRFFSPIMPDFFLHPFQGPLVSNCVSRTPIDAKGDPGTLCGLAYPFNRGYPDQSGVLSPPNGQVFDEVYFPVDAYNDVKGMELCRPSSTDCRFNYFDPEPPLAKLFIAAGEWGHGWYRAHFEGAKGDYIDLGFNTFGWRIAACIFGILCVPMMYLFARRLWPNRLFALAAAILVCFDGMFFIQSRIGMIDIIPIFFILLAYFLYLVHIQSQTSRASVVSLFLLGIVLGVGIASKWIVLAAFASIVLLLVMRAVRRVVTVHIGPSSNPIWDWGRGDGPAIAGGVYWPTYLVLALVALVAIPLVIYVASWYPFFARGQFHTMAALIDYQKSSFEYHAHLTATHPYGSPWWSWPFLSRPVLYYAEYSGLGIDKFTGQPLVAWMANLGNPWIWWTSLPCV